MKRRVRLSVDQVEARTLPSPVTSAGVFLPPGVTRFFGESSEAPPPVQVGRDGSVTFMPPGMTRFFGESSEAPPPIQVSPEGTVGFQPPGVIKGFNPQPDPPGHQVSFITSAQS